MNIQRRNLLAGLGALLAAPAIIRTPGLLMPVKAAPIRGATLAEIMELALSNRAGKLAEEITRHNALLHALRQASRPASGVITMLALPHPEAAVFKGYSGHYVVTT